MPQNNLELIPFLIKLIAVFIGGVISLVLGGDIKLDSDDNAKLNLNAIVFVKLICAIGIGLFIGEFGIGYFDFYGLNYYAQSAILMMFSMFGMLIFGIVYRSIQLTLHEKTLSEIITEIKNVIKALMK